MKTARILIVEDEPSICDIYSTLLQAAGFDIVGPAMNVKSAHSLILSEGCDAAILDFNLRGETSEEVARALSNLGRPFIVVSGSFERLPSSYRGAPKLLKPFTITDLLSAVRGLLPVPVSKCGSDE